MDIIFGIVIIGFVIFFSSIDVDDSDNMWNGTWDDINIKLNGIILGMFIIIFSICFTLN